MALTLAQTQYFVRRVFTLFTFFTDLLSYIYLYLHLFLNLHFNSKVESFYFRRNVVLFSLFFSNAKLYDRATLEQEKLRAIEYLFLITKAVINTIHLSNCDYKKQNRWIAGFHF